LYDIGTSRVVVGAITYCFGGLKGRNINNIDSCSHSNNNNMNNDNGGNGYSNYWNIEDLYKRILKEILIISLPISSPSSAMIQGDFLIIVIFIDMLNLNYSTHKNIFNYRKMTQDDIKGHKISKRIS